MGRYLRKRTVAVMMHHAREPFSERGYSEETATSTSGPVPQMPWSMAIELWHRIKSDLLASGVPPARILPRRIYQVLSNQRLTNLQVLSSRNQNGCKIYQKLNAARVKKLREKIRENKRKLGAACRRDCSMRLAQCTTHSSLACAPRSYGDQYPS
ncbi:hypothetical protein F4678DRAFT_446219 [Xylaria arbuscula]|nr:hypothetical protein F4678DRAFT_446219 [Xylaria arbuscula]